MNLDRARGALLGLAVGDALGTTLEFTEPPAPGFPMLATGPHRDIIGGGPFGLAPGQVTDDTHMASCLAASLAACGGLDVADAAARYVAWMPHTFDVGAQTRDALGRIAAGTPPARAGRAVWLDRDRRAAGNGSLMRTAPIGVALAADGEARRRASCDDSAITHFDPRCQLACAAFNAAIAAAVLDRAGAPAALIEAMRAELAAAALELTARWPGDAAEIGAARTALNEDLDAAAWSDPQLYGPELHLHGSQGFVRVAFRLAAWELLHAPALEAALIDVVNRGGDADTNGAITGALLGAWHGAGALPAAWSARVLDALQEGPPGPLRDLYHPRRLLDLTAG